MSDGIRTVAAGDALLSPVTTRARERKGARGDGAGLERAAGHEIAEQLFLGPLTVRTHVQRARTELDAARSRAQLAAIVYRVGLVRHPW
ncbi:hypothetical protein [Streptomyces sp. NPDC059906]|uniref:hypothetical protein n=1 Tax=Streptomyces sp. NPDC059906 TaxID=3346997 RepID=UPI0036481FAE